MINGLSVKTPMPPVPPAAPSDVQVKFPKDVKQRKVIDCLAKFVAKNGAQFERLIIEEEQEKAQEGRRRQAVLRGNELTRPAHIQPEDVRVGLHRSQVYWLVIRSQFIRPQGTCSSHLTF